MPAPSPRVPYRRRNLLVKLGFQLRFALWPIALFTLFLLASGHYLHGRLRDDLELSLYMPHSRLQNPWEVVGPAVWEVSAVGAAVFLVALAAWGWRRFSRLHADFERLALWAAPLARGREPDPLPLLRDGEVASLGRGLEQASHGFSAWDRELSLAVDGFADAAAALGGEPSGEALGAVRERLSALGRTLDAYRVEEDLG